MKRGKISRLVLFFVAAALAFLAGAAILFPHRHGRKDFVDRNDPSKIVFSKSEPGIGSNEEAKAEIDNLIGRDLEKRRSDDHR